MPAPMPSPMPGGPPSAGMVSEGPPGAMGVRQGRPSGMPYYGMMKKGGRVKKSGLYHLKKGEHVIPLSRLTKA